MEFTVGQKYRVNENGVDGMVGNYHYRGRVLSRNYEPTGELLFQGSGDCKFIALTRSQADVIFSSPVDPAVGQTWKLKAGSWLAEIIEVTPSRVIYERRGMTGDAATARTRDDFTRRFEYLEG